MLGYGVWGCFGNGGNGDSWDKCGIGRDEDEAGSWWEPGSADKSSLDSEFTQIPSLLCGLTN